MENDEADTIPDSEPPIFDKFLPTTDEEIDKIIKSLSNKQCKLDPIPAWVLKKFVIPPTPLIKTLLNKSFEEGYVPVPLKSALIRPILKDANLDSNDMGNYRPVSNLCTLAKILEKAVYKRLNTHFTEHCLLDENQSAYRKCYSTETVLVRIQNDILKELDKGHIMALVMIDVSAAFDTVKHGKLIECLSKFYGISGKALEWMKSYLSNRRQAVVIDNEQSEYVLMEYGFPQGAILAGLLYNAFSAPLSKVVKRHSPTHKGYADDNQSYSF